jgi:hypothetical protein
MKGGACGTHGIEERYMQVSDVKTQGKGIAWKAYVFMIL